MSLPPPTERQREVLRAIVRLWSRDQRLPTIREVARLLALGSTHAVTCHYLLLSRKGLLGSVAMVSRGSRPTPAGLAAIGLPPEVQPSGLVRARRRALLAGLVARGWHAGGILAPRDACLRRRKGSRP